MSLETLIHDLTRTSVLKSEAIVDAFTQIDRIDFVPAQYREAAYDDRPLPIAKGQTISQPTTVAFMLELLQVKKGDHVLDVGTGSGWTTALLAYLVGPGGQVYGTERLEELINFGRNNLEKFSFSNVRILNTKNVLGLPEYSPFDKILVSAASEQLPTKLSGQLKPDGVLVIPIANAIWKISKIDNDTIQTEKYEGFVFVPLIE